VAAAGCTGVTLMTTVFISHSTKDRDAVERLIIQPLEKGGIRTWYSKEAIRGGQEWQDRIMKGLQDSEYFLVALSPDSENSEWVRSEVSWGISRRRDKFLPIMLSSCQLDRIDLRLSSIQSFQVGDTEKIFAFLGVTSEDTPLSSWRLVRPLMAVEEVQFLTDLLILSDEIRKTRRSLLPGPYYMLKDDDFYKDELKKLSGEHHELVDCLDHLAEFIERVATQKEPMWKLRGRVRSIWIQIEIKATRNVWYEEICKMDLNLKLRRLEYPQNKLILEKLQDLQGTIPHNIFEKPSLSGKFRNYWLKK
jgi:hypothetical protein